MIFEVPRWNRLDLIFVKLPGTEVTLDPTHRIFYSVVSCGKDLFVIIK